MLTENDVVEAVSKYLEKNGYIVNQALTTSQHGIDIVATAKNGKQCFIEAKGATSSKSGSNRYGKEFTVSQINTHIGVALVKAFQTLQIHPSQEVAIAVPGNNGHRKVINSMLIPIRNSGIGVLFVNENKNVEKYL